MLSFTIGRASISIMIDGEFNTVDKSAANYEALKVELQKPEGERDEAAIKSLISTKKMIEAFSYGKVKITEDERVLYEGDEITNYLASRMLQILNEGFDVTPFAKFMERVYANPQAYTRDELYEWLEAADLPIMSDGRFIAFKKVTKDHKDVKTKSFDNSVGSVLEMSRKGCDPDRNNDCSTGFHFCSAGYLSHYSGDRVMVVAIDPADVTAIPRDYNRTKGRTCRYEVIGELSEQSQAFKDAWKRGVVEFEDPTELPDVSFETKPKSVKALKPMRLGDDRGKASLTGLGSKQVTTSREPAKPIVGKVSKAPTKDTAAPKKTVAEQIKGAAKAGAELVFTTKDKRKITATQIKDAMTSAGENIRGAARILFIQDSTLRGWLTKIKEMTVAVAPTGPMAPTAATRTPTGLIFKTTDGREIAQSDVQAALDANKGSNRGAGRALSVNESTIRSWRTKGGF